MICSGLYCKVCFVIKRFMRKNCRNHKPFMGATCLRALLLCVLLVVVANFSAMSLGTWSLSVFCGNAKTSKSVIPEGITSSASVGMPMRAPKHGDIVVRHADQITYDEARLPGVQIFVGNVEFFHDGVILKCDSANFYQEDNSFTAFDHINMRQGDTLSLKCNYLFYEGNTGVAHASRNAVLKHRNTTLTSDSMDYNRFENKGYFYEGGKLVDGANTLTSDLGEYDAKLRRATFFNNVYLESTDYFMKTNILYYNVVTKDAWTEGPSNITSGTSNIYTENGHFNTSNNKAILLNRSVITDKGSKMVADSIVYDKALGEAEGFGDFVYNDDTNKTIMTGDYCYYNDSIGYCKAYDKALIKNYSEPDTLFMHADTLEIHSFNLKTDSVYRVVKGFYHVRSYRTDVQSVADSIAFNTKEKRLSLYGNPVVWNNKNQIVGEEIHTYFDESNIDSIYVVNQALLCERLDSVHYNQVASKEMHMYFKDGELHESHALQNVNINYFQFDDKAADSVVIAMNHAETSLLKLYMKDKKVSNVWTAETEGMFYPIVFVTPKIMYLDNFAWFDYMRPRDKYDLFEWRGKSSDKMLQKSQRREVPLQKLKKKAE